MRPTSDEILVIARTLYGEASDQSVWGKIAVLRTIQNRARRSWRGQTTLADVCLDPAQYSAWSDEPWNRKNRARMERATLEDNAFLSCYSLACTALAIFKGAERDWWPYPPQEVAIDHYLTVTDFNKHREGNPSHWSQSSKLQQFGAIGDHVFFVHQ